MSNFRQKGRENNAKVFLNDFNQSKTNSYFVSIGNAVTSPTTTTSKLTDCVETDQYTWDNMFVMNEIFRTDVSLMIKKIDWISNTRYEAFDKSKNQYELNEKFYAYNNSNNNVYLCLASPENENALSTYAPTGETVEAEIKQDGYIWKFLYKLNDIDLEKFDYPGFIPVKETGTDLYTDERILQQNVQSNSIKGAIEAIDVVVQGSAYSAAVNPNFENAFYAIQSVVTATADDGSTTISVLVDGTLQELNKTQNFYLEKYVINFENGYTALIDGSGFNSEGNFQIDICADQIVQFGPTGTLPPTTVQFRILPAIKIIGNGNSAWAIPVLDTAKKLTKIKILTSGSNFSYAEARMLVNNGTVLKPIIGLNGLATDITQILGAKHVMISKKIKPVTTLSESDPVIYSLPENIGLVYDGPQYKDVISPNTFYTQLALIKSPKILNEDNLEEVAGTQIIEVKEMVLEAINPKITITIGTSTNPYTNPSDFFEENDIIVRGPDNHVDQFRAKISEVMVTAFTTILVCDLINGAFETYSGYKIKNLKETTETLDDAFLVFLDCDDNCSKAIKVQYENTFLQTDFINDDALYGTVSLETTEIKQPLTGYAYVNPLYPTRAKVKVNNPGTGFIPARYQDGEYIPGEIITSVKTNGTTTVGVTRGTLVSVSEPIEYIGEQTLGYSYILECVIDRNGIDTAYELVNSDNISLETNILIRQGTSGTLGKIVRVGIPSGTGDSNIVYLYVNNYNGAFYANAQTKIYKINSLYEPTEYVDMKMTIQSIIYQPKLVRYSGNLLYINDVGPVQRKLENTENIKLLVEF
jgi:hypothetical protein